VADLINKFLPQLSENDSCLLHQLGFGTQTIVMCYFAKIVLCGWLHATKKIFLNFSKNVVVKTTPGANVINFSRKLRDSMVL
jgi:hypothetical protein